MPFFSVIVTECIWRVLFFFCATLLFSVNLHSEENYHNFYNDISGLLISWYIWFVYHRSIERIGYLPKQTGADKTLISKNNNRISRS